VRQAELLDWKLRERVDVPAARSDRVTFGEFFQLIWMEEFANKLYACQLLHFLGLVTTSEWACFLARAARAILRARCNF